jgi:hypothetical protein
MNTAPLTEEEKALIIAGGWKFLSDDHIYIPEDYDGCMASGIEQIRKVLFAINRSRNRD